MPEDAAAGKRDLVARVATLELLVADLVDTLWRVDPAAMEKLSRAATRDLEIQHARTLQAAEHQRERLFTVLNTRRRMLKPRRPEDDPCHGGLGG